MAYSCLIDKNRGRGVITLFQSVDDSDVIEAMKAVFESDEWSPELNSLWDCEGITELIIDREGLDRVVTFAAQLHDLIGPGKSAFVVRRQLDESMTKIILHMTKTNLRERRVFRNREEALQWLSE